VPGTQQRGARARVSDGEGSARARPEHLEPTKRFAVREYRPGDEHGILALFRRVFRVERSLAHWRWKYEDNPAGRQVTVAVSDGGEIVGQFASLPNRGTAAGTPLLFSQLLDHMVERDIHRRGIYAAMTRDFLARFVAPEPGAVYFGFNLEEIFRIEQHLYGMELMHGVSAWTRTVDAGTASHRGRRLESWLYEVAEVERFDGEIDALWRRCSERYPSAIVRDASYLNWRYADCPDVDYVLLLARHRLTRRPCGLAVLRRGWLAERFAALVDWLVPDAQPAVWRSLLAAAGACARDAELDAVKLWLAPSSPDHGLLPGLGFASEPSPFLTSAMNRAPAAPPIDRLGAEWHYTMGDTDIF
jgi:hypothetical protein